jgi:DNA repair protein RecN (Recombination protein N)
MLALKTSFAQSDPVGTMIFDEIDTGVSGRVSQAIALQLFQLSRSHQVLCVTHQPIIAAIADCHFHVSKHVYTELTELAPDQTATNGTANATNGKNGRSPRKSAKPSNLESDNTTNAGSSNNSNQLGDAKSTPKPKQTDKTSKTTTQERTVVKVQLLEPDQRKQELAQLAGGVSFTVTHTSSDVTTRKRPRGKNSKPSTSPKSTKSTKSPQSNAASATEVISTTATEITPDSAIAFAESLLNQAEALKKQVVG